MANSQELKLSQREYSKGNMETASKMTIQGKMKKRGVSLLIRRLLILDFSLSIQHLFSKFF
jgi:hypothetical protein